MFFVSFEFIIFIVIVFVGFWNIPDKYRWVVILLANYVFYSFAGIQYVILLLYVSISSFYFPRFVKKCKYKSLVLFVSVLVILAPLLIFKYTGFVQENVNIILASLKSARTLTVMKLALPLGISFYTFSALGYALDVMGDRIETEQSFLHYATSLSFFPCLISGPIERQHKLIPQILSEKVFDYNKITYGLKLIAWGLYKKTVIADGLSIYVDAIWNDLYLYDGMTLAVGIFFYSIQIYCDFSGYSDMAKGIAYLFGIELTTNFKSPYFSSSIHEFWKRWHISLSTWFRDYIYIPLGGSRCGTIRKAINLIITMLISGLWHGADWKYVAWGGIYGILQVGESWQNSKKKNIVIVCLKRFLVFAICSMLWVLFRSETFGDAVYVVENVFHLKFDFNALVSIGLPKKALVIAFMQILILAIFDYYQLKYDVIAVVSKTPVYVRWSVYVILVLIIAQFSYKGSAGTFVYAGF